MQSALARRRAIPGARRWRWARSAGRSALSRREARLPVWDVALVLAAIVFLFDVAVRRLALDWSSLLRRGVVEAPETTLAGRVATRDQSERVARPRGVSGQIDDSDPLVPVVSPDASSPSLEQDKTSDRSAAMQRLLEAKRKKQQGDDA